MSPLRAKKMVCNDMLNTCILNISFVYCSWAYASGDLTYTGCANGLVHCGSIIELLNIDNNVIDGQLSILSNSNKHNESSNKSSNIKTRKSKQGMIMFNFVNVVKIEYLSNTRIIDIG